MLIGVKQTGQGTRPIAKLEQCPSQRGRGKQRANSCGVFTLTVPVILRKEQLASQKHTDVDLMSVGMSLLLSCTLKGETDCTGLENVRKKAV